MSRSLYHGFEGKCSEEVFNEIYNMAFARGVQRGIDQGKEELSQKIMEYVSSDNRNHADYYIVDRIEEICQEYADLTSSELDRE